jgi:uncharacterized protein (TIGR02145 family)
MKTSIRGLIFSLSILFLITCSNEDVQVKTGKIQFNFGGRTNGRQNSSTETASVLLSISKADGTVVHEMMELTLFSFGNGFVTESVELPVGEYMLTTFLVLDSANNVTYACPLEGSEQSRFVTDPLPIYFDVSENGTTTVVPQVLKVTSDDNPTSFGYVNFGFEIVEADTLVMDIDSNAYSVVEIGNQKWLSENLKTTRFQNGDNIETTSPATLDIKLENNPEYQWAYNGNESNVDIYGRLYTQYVASDNRNVCPNGWRVPSQSDFQELINYLIVNGYNYDSTTQGNKIGKSLASNSLWNSYTFADGVPGKNPETNNSSNFNGIASGIRINFDNVFLHQGTTTFWWSQDENPSGLGIGFRIQNFQAEADIITVGDVNAGAPIRCLKTE